MANDYRKTGNGKRTHNMKRIQAGSGRSPMQRGGATPLPDELQRRQDKRKLPDGIGPGQ